MTKENILFPFPMSRKFVMVTRKLAKEKEPDFEIVTKYIDRCYKELN